MNERLRPPPGYASWIDFAVENMETRSLELDALFDSDTYGRHWPDGTAREQMRQAVQAELAEIRQAIESRTIEIALLGKQLTVRQLIELLHQHPENAVVLVQGYETGWDTIHAVRQSEVVEYRKAHDWDGEYQEPNQFKQPGEQRVAVLIEGRRGYRRVQNPNQ